MSVDREKKLQKRVLKILKDELEYRYIGNLEDVDNKSIREDDLIRNLKRRGYSSYLIKLALNEVRKIAYNQISGLYQNNKAFYSLLRYGAQGLKDENKDRVTVHLIDWDNLDNNDFAVAQEVSVLCFDNKGHKRPDVVIYINGIALGVFELKRSSVSIGEGIRQNLTNQKDENIARFFNTIQFTFAGNESEGLKYGTICTAEKYYLQWKEDHNANDSLSIKIKELQGEDSNRLRDGIISICQKERFLSLIYDFVIFDAGIKKLARHNQYFADIATRAFIERREGGIIWNTQGSGKSLIMVWLTKWIIENIKNSRVVIITDRDELDDQIEGLFSDVDIKIARASSGQNLRDLLNTYDESIICSLIHKYGHNAGKQADVDLYVKELEKSLGSDFEAKGEIVAFIDECHRTNSGKLHKAVRTIMPKATIIGFTGTPLLKKDKQTSREVFGEYIHTYKFDEGVEDGVVLDLRYEARDVDQNLTNQDKVDLWFETKTKGLTDYAKNKLKSSWASLNKLYSSRQRLEKIACDIIFDMETKPRLSCDRGTAMLVAGDILQACKYWEIFQRSGFKKCAVVTSYEPNATSVRTATSDLYEESESEYKKSIYERMLNGRTTQEYESEVKKKFKEEPANMKLLIVVDKLLTGFDAPSATYLYIDKSMRDHDLFQAICRVNRPDGEDKDYGYIVDYKDLFKNVQLAITDYTSGAFEGYADEDIGGLIKGRYEEAKAEMVGARASLNDLFSNIEDKTVDTKIINYFCGDKEDDEIYTGRRETFYSLSASYTRSFANCCDKLVSDYSYSEQDVNNLRREITNYNKIKEMVKLASYDYIDLKPYESDMRYILDTYVKAEDTTIISELENMSLVELLLNSEPTTQVNQIVDGLPGNDDVKAEIIDNNVTYEIVKKKLSNEVYYGKLSKMLEEVITQRKRGVLSYEEYLKKVIELAKVVIRPEDNGIYPDDIKDSEAKRAIYDLLGKEDSTTAFEIDVSIRDSMQPDWISNKQKQNKIKGAIFDTLCIHGYDEDTADNLTEEIFELVKRQGEYREI
ncbi:HsdR family type I site-specific deoxyribonuclease [Dolosigranulum pigrum]|uniref:type I restriction endonuclease subunit R n=1 Tax=Dolosigranulum pigrum TaxID=29394 RepID=UPI001AD85E07|nr:HsdR family type I site-specific deoxyribonuclease [Dolosigranulum pigrum]QTJ51620.1 HsdR family type I site-specific deoxyribonuclease [Dolosigranulum pigrum]